jgi:putative hydrolase of the HAD superfamily
MIKAAVFDLDDTLLDFLSLKRQCVDSAIDAMIAAGLTLPKAKAVERVYQIYYRDGLEDQEIFNKFLQQEMGQIDYKILAAGVLAYKKSKSLITPYPGVPETLIELIRMNISLAILTDAPKLQAWTRLIESHLQNYFPIVIGFEDTGKRKPHPDPFKMVLSKLGTLPSETLMVGDMIEKDLVGGRGAGMVTAYVMYNSSSVRKPEYEVDDFADYKLTAFPEILNIVKNHK